MDGQIQTTIPSSEQTTGMIRGFFRAGIKKERGNNCLPHSAAVIVFLLAPCHHCAYLLPF
jgi:hypothetical protein